jgi:hypothetical protein
VLRGVGRAAGGGAHRWSAAPAATAGQAGEGGPRAVANVRRPAVEELEEGTEDPWGRWNLWRRGCVPGVVASAACARGSRPSPYMAGAAQARRLEAWNWFNRRGTTPWPW